MSVDMLTLRRRVWMLLFPPKCVGCRELLPISEGMREIFCPLCRSAWEVGRVPREMGTLPLNDPVIGPVSVAKYRAVSPTASPSASSTT